MQAIEIPAEIVRDYAGWVAVINSAEAQLHGATSPMGDIELLTTYTNAAGRTANTELDSDRPGRVQDIAGVGGARHAMESTSSHDVEAKRFVTAVSDALVQTVSENPGKFLVVSAPPSLLGEIRQRFPSHLDGRVSHFINKDLVNTPASQLRGLLPERLWSTLA